MHPSKRKTSGTSQKAHQAGIRKTVRRLILRIDTLYSSLEETTPDPAGMILIDDITQIEDLEAELEGLLETLETTLEAQDETGDDDVPMCWHRSEFSEMDSAPPDAGSELLNAWLDYQQESRKNTSPVKTFSQKVRELFQAEGSHWLREETTDEEIQAAAEELHRLYTRRFNLLKSSRKSSQSGPSGKHGILQKLRDLKTPASEKKPKNFKYQPRHESLHQGHPRRLQQTSARDPLPVS